MRMLRQRLAAVLAGVLMAAAATVAGGCGAARSDPAPGASRPVTIGSAYLLQVQATVLVDARGYALYVFAPDRERAVTCTGLCAGSWPPLYQIGRPQPTAAAGVNPKLLGSDPDPTGGRVVTYNGWPLYRYAADVQPNIATGQAIDANGGYWYLIRPDGAPVDPTGDGTPPVATTGPAT